MEWVYTRQNVVGALALLGRSETLFVGGYLLVLCAMPVQVGVWSAALVGLTGWPPLLVMIGFALVIETAKVLAVPVLTRLLQAPDEDRELTGWGACLVWALLAAVWITAFDLLVLWVRARGDAPWFFAWNMQALAVALAWLALLPPFVQMAGDRALGIGYVTGRLLARPVSWFVGFFVLMFASTLGASLATNAYAHYAANTMAATGEPVSMTPIVLLTGAIKATGLLALMLYAWRAARILVAGHDGLTSEAFV